MISMIDDVQKNRERVTIIEMMKVKMAGSVKDIPIWEKFALTINEATVYFNIGEKKMRKLIDDNMDYGFMIQNGAKMLINRGKFEEFLNGTTSI